MANREQFWDANGFLHVKNVPITRVQIAMYRGDQIDKKNKLELDPRLKDDYLYGVLRSAESLFDPEVIESFEAMPFRVGHQMLGKQLIKGRKTKSVDEAPADGVLYHVRRGTKDDYVKNGADPTEFLFGDIVIYTENAISAIKRGLKQFSLGYRCSYSPVDTYPRPKYYKGKPYYFVQDDITGNHLALVPKGRAGEECAMDEEPTGTVFNGSSDDDSPVGIYDDEGKTFAYDELPEGITIMEKNEEAARQALVDILNSEDEEKIQGAVDFSMLSAEQQKALIALMKKEKDGGKSADGEAEDAKAKGAAADGAPTPPPVQDGAGEGNADAGNADGGEGNGDAGKGADAGAGAGEGNADAGKGAGDGNADGGEGNGDAEDCKGKGKKVKTYTQDEFDAACEKARKEGRDEGMRAQLLAEATDEDATGKSEADVARAACKKVKGLEFAGDASDDVAIAAIRGHLATKSSAKKADDNAAKKPAKKTLVTVAQDSAPRMQRTFDAGAFRKFLG